MYSGETEFLSSLFAKIPHLAESINAQIPKEFHDQKDGAGKIRFCLKEMEKMGILPSASEIFESKSDAASIKARTLGNKYFKDKDYVSAIVWYNRSICLAPIGSANSAIGYANRSAVYFHSGFYKFCLQNIEFALANNYPENLKDKLTTRKQECRKMLKKQEDASEKFDKEYHPLKLTYAANKSIPMMIEGLEFAKSAQFGRFIRTKKDLMPGDVVIIEDAFSKHIVDGAEYKRCANCHKENYLNLFPCCQCTRAMFCSESCQQNAHKRFHKYECKIIDGLFSFANTDVGGFTQTAIRSTLQSLTLFKNPEELQKLIKQIANKNEVFEVDYAKLNEKQQFRAVYSLSSNENKANMPKLFALAKECAIGWHLLSKHTYLCFLLRTKEAQDHFLNLLFHLFQIAVTNAHTLGHAVGNVEQYGCGIFSICSLLNHSCMPNVAKFFDKGKVMIVATRAIKAGEQLFDCYGLHVHHGHATLLQRQAKLKSQYYFECKCKACRSDFPLIQKMAEPRDSNFLAKFAEDFNHILEFDKNFAEKKLKEIKKQLIEYSKKTPGLELYCTEDLFRHAVWTLMFGRPLNMQLKPI